ncbi:hypothetical protein VPH35_041426 [Triticum aestivum]|uniref:Uncharacterized protein n=1 Tax=Aegilops tauschii TaxID=37682 RepID=M8D2I4_AEGTA
MANHVLLQPAISFARTDAARLDGAAYDPNFPRALPPFDVPPLDARHPCTPEKAVVPLQKQLHPSHVQLGCGKKEHEEELYRERHQWDWDPRRKDYFRREMVETPFRFGRCPNFGVEKRATKRNSTVRRVNIARTGIYM